jgi:hypothetical protein
MSLSDETLSIAEVATFVERMEAAYGNFSALVRQERELPSTEAVQKMMTIAMKLFVAHHELGERFDPVGRDVGATEVAILTSAMLEAVNLEVFELSIWHGLSQEERQSRRQINESQSNESEAVK